MSLSLGATAWRRHAHLHATASNHNIHFSRAKSGCWKSTASMYSLCRAPANKVACSQKAVYSVELICIWFKSTLFIFANNELAIAHETHESKGTPMVHRRWNSSVAQAKHLLIEVLSVRLKMSCWHLSVIPISRQQLTSSKRYLSRTSRPEVIRLSARKITASCRLFKTTFSMQGLYEINIGFCIQNFGLWIWIVF